MSKVLDKHPLPWQRGDSIPQAQSQILDANGVQVTTLRKLPNQEPSIESIVDTVIAGINGAPLPAAVLAPATQEKEHISVVVEDLDQAPVIVTGTSVGTVLVISKEQLSGLTLDQIRGLVGLPSEEDAPVEEHVDAAAPEAAPAKVDVTPKPAAPVKK
jgi:hypothetical protein